MTSKIKITINDGMVNIDSPDFSYSAINGMYLDGMGRGLQVNESLKHCSEELEKECNAIAVSLFKIEREYNSNSQMILKGHHSKKNTTN